MPRVSQRSPGRKARCQAPPFLPASSRHTAASPGAVSAPQDSRGRCLCRVENEPLAANQDIPVKCRRGCMWSEEEKKTIYNCKSQLFSPAHGDPAHETDGEDAFQECVITHHRAAESRRFQKGPAACHPTQRGSGRDAGTRGGAGCQATALPASLFPLAVPLPRGSHCAGDGTVTSGHRNTGRSRAAAHGAGAGCSFKLRTRTGSPRGTKTVRPLRAERGLGAGARGGGRGRDRDGGARGEERGAPRPLAFRTREQVRGPGAPAPADTRPPRGRRGAQGLPRARTLLFPRKKTVAVRVGFLVTLLSSFPEPIHACGDVTACHPPGARTAAKRVQCGPLAGAQMTPPGGVGRGSGRAGPENDRTQCSGSELGARGGRMSGG